MQGITDVIKLNDEQESIMRSLWANPDKDEYVPSDLFYANTMPLRNFSIETDLMRIEYHVYDDPIEKTYGLTDGHIDIFLDVLINPLMDKEIRFEGTIGATRGTDFTTIVSLHAFINGKEVEVGHHEETYWLMRKAVGLWYGAEIALLHPTVKDVFLHPHSVKEKIPKEERKNYDHKVYRYVKHHIINTDELNTALYGKGEYHRHALAWYVTGHWRTYKNGKTVFIQGYWKGALRDTKKADIRSRELVI